MSCCCGGLGLQIPWHNITAAPYEIRQVEQGGVWRSQTHLSYTENPPGFTRWRAPVCRRGRHLPNGSEDKLWGCRKNIDARLQGERGEAQERECKCFKRSVPLHHCWLSLILWAFTNNGRLDFCFRFFVTATPPQKKKEKLTKHCYLCRCYATSKCAQCGVCKRWMCRISLLNVRVFSSLFHRLDWEIRIRVTPHSS